MVISVQGELIVHIDVTPSEQVFPDDKTVLCMLGLVCDEPEGLVGLKQYKYTTAKGNSIAKKARVANQITEAINQDKLSLHAVACLAQRDRWYQFGLDFLNKIPSTVLETTDTGYLLDGDYIPHQTAAAMATYATGLAVIALRASIWSQALGVKKIKILLDRLPNRDVGDATKLLNVIVHHPQESMPIWNDMREKFDVDFEFGDNWFYQPQAGAPQLSGKNHPNAIITDWIAQSAFAAGNSHAWRGSSPRTTEEHRKSIAGPFFALHEKRRLHVVSLNNLVVSSMQSQ